MEITVKHRFITKFYGSAPAKGSSYVLQKYIEGKIDDSLITFAQKNAKKNQNIEELIFDILSIFHRNGSEAPVLGSWMLRKCMLNTGAMIFNAVKDKSHPKKAAIPMAIANVEPLHMEITRGGNRVEKPDGVDTYATSIVANGKVRSFFKAYEFINPGSEFDATYLYDDDLVSEELFRFWVEKAGKVGVGAFRERFGKFEVA